MSLERLEKVKDIFIFACYTGLAYVDIENLSTENIVIGIDGQKWVYTFRAKTGNKSNIPLLLTAIALLENIRAIQKTLINKNFYQQSLTLKQMRI